MPVTTKPSYGSGGCNSDEMVNSVDGLLQKWKRPYVGLVQSSFGNLDPDSKIIPYRGGVMKGIIRAFQQNLHLVLRPDDIWLSILTQFSFIKGVCPKGRKNFMIDVTQQSPWNVDIGTIMTRLIQENVMKGWLRDWITANFSTTTDTDRSVAAIVMIGTLNTYLDYEGYGGYGFPSVTLLGERWDWELILHKVEKMPFDVNEEWRRRLTPIIKLMIETFDVPNSQHVKYFWLQACHSTTGEFEERGTLSGWLTAFCYWSGDGSRTKDFSDEDLLKFPTPLKKPNRLILDGVTYPIISTRSIPQSVLSVLVTLQDDETRLQYETQLLGGCVGMTATTVDRRESLNIVQPRSDWWMLGQPSRA